MRMFSSTKQAGYISRNPPARRAGAGSRWNIQSGPRLYCLGRGSSALVRQGLTIILGISMRFVQASSGLMAFSGTVAPSVSEYVGRHAPPCSRRRSSASLERQRQPCPWYVQTPCLTSSGVFSSAQSRFLCPTLSKTCYQHQGHIYMRRSGALGDRLTRCTADPIADMMSCTKRQRVTRPVNLMCLAAPERKWYKAAPLEHILDAAAIARAA